MTEHSYDDDDRRVLIGQLRGIETRKGLSYVAIEIAGGDVIMSADEFPALEWIERNQGKWVKVVTEHGRVVKTKIVDQPPKTLLEGYDPETGRKALKCAFCGKVVFLMSWTGVMDRNDVQKAGNSFAEHVVEEHPDEAERMFDEYRE